MKAIIIDRPIIDFIESSLVHTSLTTRSVVSGTVYCTPFQVPWSFRLHAISCEIVTAGGAGALLRMGLYGPSPTQGMYQLKASGSIFAPLVLDSGNLDADVTGAVGYEVSPSIGLIRGIYWGVVVCNNNVNVLRRWNQGALWMDWLYLGTLQVPPYYDLSQLEGVSFDIPGGYGAFPSLNLITTLDASVAWNIKMGLMGQIV